MKSSKGFLSFSFGFSALLAVLLGNSIFSLKCHAAPSKPTPIPGLDPRGEPEVTICSQNLENYGTFIASRSRNPALTLSTYKKREQQLVKRFLGQRCDVIAVQEVMGKSDQEAEEALRGLGEALKLASNRYFDAKVAPSNDRSLHVGFLVAKDRASILNDVAYLKVELPKLTEKQKPRLFLRSPMELQIEVKGRDVDSGPKTINLVNFHFKSRAQGSRDPAELEYETYRLEMAEGLRRIVERRHARCFASGETLLVLLGDRNSNFDTASAKILEGSLTLQNFQKDGSCRLSKRGVPLCKTGSTSAQRLFSVLTEDPETSLKQGTFHFKTEYSWIDDILMPMESLTFARERFDSEGNYSSGVVYTPSEAADHAMVWVRLNW